MIPQIQTVIVWGEGECEYEFLRYLKGAFHARGCGISVFLDHSHGKGPDHVVYSLSRHLARRHYDERIILMDVDMPWTNDVTRAAKEIRAELLGSSPCLEGILLRALGRAVPPTSEECKRDFERRFGPANDARVYDRNFTESAIRGSATHIPTISRLVDIFSRRT